jgi:hypothetical protein
MGLSRGTALRTDARHIGYRVSHDRGAVTVGNEAPVWPSPTPGSATTMSSATSRSDQHHHARLRLVTRFLPLDALALPAGRVLFVAGSPYDIPGAGQVGMDVWWHNRVGMPARPGPRPIAEHRSLDPLPAYAGLL